MCAASALLCTAMSTSCCCARRSSLPALPGAASASTSAATTESSAVVPAGVARLPSTCTKLDSLSPDGVLPGDSARAAPRAEAPCGVGTHTGPALSGRCAARCRSAARRVA